MKKIIIVLFISFMVCLHTYSQTSDNRKPNLFILTLGINDYKYLSDLQFCVNDAIAIEEAFSKNTKYIYDEVYAKILLDSNVVADSVEEAINFVIKNSKPKDTFIFSFSGHNFSTPDKYTMLNYYDYKPEENNKEGGSNCGVDIREIDTEILSTWISKIEANNVCLIFDTDGDASEHRWFFNNMFKDKLDSSFTVSNF